MWNKDNAVDKAAYRAEMAAGGQPVDGRLWPVRHGAAQPNLPRML
ncbi:hypothetical protein [Kitasatospora aureofaciens]